MRFAERLHDETNRQGSRKNSPWLKIAKDFGLKTTTIRASEKKACLVSLLRPSPLFDFDPLFEFESN